MSKREVQPVAFWRNAHDVQPPAGSTVLGLSRYGVLISIQWSSKSILFIDAWSPYPSIPKDIKDLQSSRFTIKGETQ